MVFFSMFFQKKTRTLMPLSFAQPKYLLEKIYDNLLRILDSYRKEVRTSDKSSLETQKDLEKFDSLWLQCKIVAANQRWDTLNLPHIYCMMDSKLSGSLIERWNIEL